MIERATGWVERWGWWRAAAALVLAYLLALFLTAHVVLRAAEARHAGLWPALATLVVAALALAGLKFLLLLRVVDRLIGERRRLEGAIARQDAAGRRLREISLLDEATGLGNRRFLLDAGERMVAEARRGGRPIAVVVVDLDRFKEVNDAHGHLEGDRVLRGFARRLRGVLRGGDLAARFGGDEFVALLPGTDAAGAAAACERLREGTRRSARLRGVTVSAGVAAGRGAAADLQELLARADGALLEAKRAGRDRVAVAPAPPAATPAATPDTSPADAPPEAG